MRFPHPRFPSVVALLTLLPLLTGCGSMGLHFRTPVTFGTSEPRVGPGQLTQSAVQSEVMSFSDSFNGAIAQQWNQVAARARGSTSPTGQPVPSGQSDRAAGLQRAALENKLAAVSASLSIASEPNPTVSLADMITLVTLQRMVLDTPEARERYGADSVESLLRNYRDQENRIWRIAERAMTPDQRDELRRLIADWRTEHPETTYVSSVRLEDFAATRQQPTWQGGGRSSGSLLALVALDPLAGLDPTQREVHQSRLLGERLFFYASRSPQILKWQAESLYQSMLRAPELQRALTAAESASSSAAHFSSVADRIPEDVAAERTAAVDQVFARLSQERQAAVADINQAISGQREAFLRDLDQAQGRFDGTLRDFRQTADATAGAADAITRTTQAAESLVTRFQPPPGTPPQPSPPGPSGLEQYNAAVVQTSAAADRLTTLVQSLDHLLVSPAATEKTAAIHTAALDVQQRAAGLIDRAFWRLLILVLVAPIAVAASVGVYRWLVGRA